MDRIQKLQGVSVMVIGDVMLDVYADANLLRTMMPGGAANAAANVASMGGKAIVVGVVGEDRPGQVLEELLAKRGITSNTMVVDKGRPTTTKETHTQGRRSKESLEPLGPLAGDRLFAIASQLISHVDAVLLSDYGKGTLKRSMASCLIQLARSAGKPVVVDPWGVNVWKYQGASVIKPNLFEVVKLAGGTEEKEPLGIVADCVSKLWLEYDVPYFVTCGDAGAILCTDGKFNALESHRVKAVCEVGAGDSAAAALALAIGARMELREAAELANMAGAAAVAKSMTANVTAAEMRAISRDRVRR